MRTKHLFLAALALPLAFAACNNEELVLENQPQVEQTKVVGNELIAHGATVNLVEGVESRYSGGGFDGTDRLGLAWWNNPTKADKTIYDAQSTTSFTHADATGKIYNNALVQKNMETGDFFVNGDIYAGAYFVYFPYQRVGKVQPLTVDYTNYPQTEAYTRANVADKQMEHALHLSHKMLLSDEAVDADFNVNISTQPVRAASAIGVLTNLGSKGDYTDAMIETIELKSVTISANKVKFTTKATIDQNALPVAVLDVNDEFDAQATADQIVEAIYNGNVLKSKTQKASMTTLVNFDNNIADENIVLLYSYPAAVSGKSTTASIIVETNVGTFTYNSTDEDAPNYEAIVKLLQYANGEVEMGVDAEGNPIYFGFDKYNAKNATLSLTLDLEDMVLDTEVATAAEWNALMPFLAAAGDEEVTVTLTDNIQFGGEIDEVAQPDFTLPAGVKVTAEGAYSITFAGEQVIEDEFVSNVDINVAKDATLTVESEFTSADIVNKGTINVQEGAKIIGNAANKTLTNAEGVVNCDGEIQTNIEIVNTDGIINVTYKKSYVAHDGNGIIAGTLDTNVTKINDDPVAAIYQMIRDDAYAAVKCNQLTLKNFELAYGDKTSPWSTEKYQIGAGSFNGINLILENSSLASTTTEMYINNLKATNSPINGIFHVTGNLETEGETLAGTYTVDGDMSVASAAVEGGYTVTGDFKAENAELEGTYNANDVVLNAVIVAKNTEINATGDLTINPVSTITRATLNANNVMIEGSTKAVTLKGTNMTALGNVTINAANLKLTNDKEKVGNETTLYPSKVIAYGKIENENGGKVNKEAGCTTTEDYAEVLAQEALKADQDAMQEYVDNMTSNPTNYVELADQLKAYAQLSDITAHPEYNAVKFAKLMKTYFVDKNGLDFEYNDTYYTESNIKLFEILIGKKIVF